MPWTSLVRPRAIISRRRFVANAIVYSLSLTVRFTSMSGSEIETSPSHARTTKPGSAIMIDDGAAIFQWSSPRLAQPFAFHFGPPASPAEYRAIYEGLKPMPAIPTCPPRR